MINFANNGNGSGLIEIKNIISKQLRNTNSKLLNKNKEISIHNYIYI